MSRAGDAARCLLVVRQPGVQARVADDGPVGRDPLRVGCAVRLRGEVQARLRADHDPDGRSDLPRVDKAALDAVRRHHPRVPGKIHQEQPRAEDGRRGTAGGHGDRPATAEQQSVVAAQQQVGRLITEASAGGVEVQAAGHRPRGRVDDLQDTAGDGDDPAAIRLDQVGLVHPGLVVVRAGICRCGGRRSRSRRGCSGRARPGRGRRPGGLACRVRRALRRPGDSGQAEGADAGFGRPAQGSKLIAAAMKGHQPRRTGPRGTVLMHRRPHGPARAARYHQQAARYNSGVLAAKVSCHAASTAAT